jgi:ribosomal-protein-alanine N-acetyltransferase
MNIRQAAPDDLAGIIELSRNTPVSAQWSDRAYKAVLEDAHPSRIALVAEIDGRIAGFVVARIAADECELEDIAVGLADQRRRIGSELIRNVISIVRGLGVRRIFLEVRESNAQARGFYEKSGFSRVGTRTGYYSTPAADAIIYVLDLAGELP